MPNPPTFWPEWAQIISLPVGIIGIVIASLAIWVTIRLSRHSLKDAVLATRFEAIVMPVELKADEDIQSDIRILYKGKPVSNLFVVRGKLRNMGSRVVRGSQDEKDVEKPVTFTLSQNAKFLDAKVVQIPDYASASVTYEDRESTLLFKSLEPREEIIVQFICEGTTKGEVPRVGARISGVKVPDPTEKQMRFAIASTVVMLVIGLLMIGVGAAAMIWPRPAFWLNQISISANFLVLLGVLVVMKMLFDELLETGDVPSLREYYRRRRHNP